MAGFANLAETGNFSVLFTLIGLFLIYVLAVILARRADKRHELLVGICALLTTNLKKSQKNIL